MEKIIKIIAEELNIKEKQVEATINLIDEGNTIPFIARYRKEVTGGLSDEILRELGERLTYLRNLEKRKEEVLKSIEEQGKLTEEISKSVVDAVTLAEVEDIYRPYKPKKKTRATIAKAKGLEPLANIILAQEDTQPLELIAQKFVTNVENTTSKDKIVANIEEAIAGALDIIAEMISDNPIYRKKIKSICYREAIINVRASDLEEKSSYEMYYEFNESIKTLPSHRILAINRGEKEGILKVKIDKPEDKILNLIQKDIIKRNTQFETYLISSIQDSWKRLIEPSIDREIRSDLTQKAEEKAIRVFGKNAKQLLLGAPIKNLTVIGFDPAYRTGCKIAVIDETGKVLDTTTIYPTQPQNDIENSTKILLELINKYDVNIFAIGNGTASRESEVFVADVIKKAKQELNKNVHYAIVSEAGASVYSASKLATEEYPNINVSLRGAISIARRLQDPLAELVKIEPKSIGVGQYQHDVDQKKLSESLTGVVEDAVNKVGVDINTATPSLLQYISGINKTIANNIVKYRDENGKIKERKELLKVPKLGKTAFEQCAGFIRIPDGKNPLEITAVHPESYEIAEKILDKIGYSKEELKDKEKLKKIKMELLQINISNTAKELKIGEITLKDIIDELSKPGRDPREDMPKAVLREDILKFEDLREGQILTGTVRNVTDFGAFVDVGIKHDGLVHISELSNSYVKNPSDIVSVGDIVKVIVIGIDIDKQKVKLSMKI